jgi:hypothetical protein
MKTWKKVLLAVVGVIGIALAWWLGSPLFITNRVSEALPTVPVETILAPSAVPPRDRIVVITPAIPGFLAEGPFSGFDKLHRATGTARLIKTGEKTYVRFEEDFTVTNGPDLFVHLGKDGKYDPAVNLGRLKGNEGSQNYEIPAGVNIDEYSEIWIWCRAFSVPFGKVVLTRAAA